MKKKLSQMDLGLFSLTIIYAIFGSIMIYSASSILTVLSQGVPSYYYFVKQLIILAIGMGLGMIVLFIPTSKYKYFVPFLIAGIGALLLGLTVYGKIKNGTQGWYDLGFFNLQPAELAKSVMIIYMACNYYHLIKAKERMFFKYLIPVMVGGFFTFLVLIQPDFGSAAIIGGIVMMIFIATPIAKVEKNKCYKVLDIGLIVGIMGLVLFGNEIINPYQLNRLNYRNPCSRYAEKTGYQVCNGFIAIKNGGLFGRGFGNSTQKYLYLPEAHTDFIFAIIVEELGLIVGIGIIVGYIIILWRILVIAKGANNIRNSILAYGTFAYLVLHLLINLLGILAVIPLTGVPLPLLSYGGSFNINVIIMLSVCQRVAIESKNAKIKEEIAAI